jgi:hypothetical protein
LASDAAATQAGSTRSAGEPLAADRQSYLQVSEGLGLAAVLALGGALLAMRLNHGWFPHDEGLLGQSAERVLLGELPHRDFDETYTGLLTYLHALAFKILGISMPVMRIPLFISALAWQAAVYRITVRFMTPLAAALVTLLTLIWSVPNYPASMPSWYNLFCATWGALALLKWLEVGRVRWLVLAGIAGGVSFLFKLTGLFFVMAGVVCIIALTATARSDEPRRPTLAWANAFVSAGLAALAVGLAMILAKSGFNDVFRFAVPVSMVAIAVVLREWTHTGGDARGRLNDLAGALTPFLIGAAVPVMLFSIWFALNGGLGALLEGVFVTPFRRTDFARAAPLGPIGLIGALPLVFLFWPRLPSGGIHRYVPLGLVSLVLVPALVLSATSRPAYVLVWWSAWSLPWLAGLVAVASASGWLSRTLRVQGRHARAIMVMSTAAVFALLVEYPFAAPIYTHYAMPLAIIAIAVLVAVLPGSPRPMQYLLLAFFIGFGLLRVVPNSTAYLGLTFKAREEHALLDLPRGGLWMPARDAYEYETVVGLVDENLRGRTLWAGPDAPEVYFLAGVQNRTRYMFDFFSHLPANSSVVNHIVEHDPGMVIVNRHPGFSLRLTEKTVADLSALYPERREVGRFLVMWR